MAKRAWFAEGRFDAPAPKSGERRRKRYPSAAAPSSPGLLAPASAAKRAEIALTSSAVYVLGRTGSICCKSVSNFPDRRYGIYEVRGSGGSADPHRMRQLPGAAGPGLTQPIAVAGLTKRIANRPALGFARGESNTQTRVPLRGAGKLVDICPTRHCCDRRP